MTLQILTYTLALGVPYGLTIYALARKTDELRDREP